MYMDGVFYVRNDEIEANKAIICVRLMYVNIIIYS
jgi:hypothetical protein